MKDTITFRMPLNPQPDGETHELEVGWYEPTVETADGEQEPGPEVYGAWTADGEQAWPCPYKPLRKVRCYGHLFTVVDVHVCQRNVDREWAWVFTLKGKLP